MNSKCYINYCYTFERPTYINIDKELELYHQFKTENGNTKNKQFIEIIVTK